MREEVIQRLSPVTAEERAILSGAAVDLSLYNRSGNAVMEQKQLLPSGSLFGIRTHTRFVDFPMHSHSYVEMIYQVQGSTTHTINGEETLTLRSGGLLLLGRGTEHAIQAAGPEDIAVNFILIPAFFDNAAISLGGNSALSVFLKNNLSTSSTQRAHLLYHVSGAPMLENLLENLILLELEESSYLRQELQQETLDLLLRHLSRQTDRLIAASKQEREQAVVLSALARIEADVHCSLSELAQQHHMELPALSRLIRRHTGCTFTELLHTARFNRAVTLLKETDLSVVDIAVSVGYENTAFFYRRFAQRYGCTPAEYRAAHS